MWQTSKLWDWPHEECAAGLELDKFSRAVNQLHDNIFEGYQDWAKQVGLPERVEEVKFRTKQTESGVLVRTYPSSPLWHLCPTALSFHHAPSFSMHCLLQAEEFVFTWVDQFCGGLDGLMLPYSRHHIFAGIKVIAPRAWRTELWTRTPR